MKFNGHSLSSVLLLTLIGSLWPPVVASEEAYHYPAFVFRTGPFAPSGIPSANASRDFVKLINERDGGVDGIKLVYEECETQYNTKLGVE